MGELLVRADAAEEEASVDVNESGDSALSSANQKSEISGDVDEEDVEAEWFGFRVFCGL